jgi:murein DD-endopeptidase MepM/ murein hydrolase activator NlpD
MPGGAPQAAPVPVETAATSIQPSAAVSPPSAIPTDGIRRGGIDSTPLAAPGRTSSAAPAVTPEPAVSVASATPPRSELVAPPLPVTAAPEPTKVPARLASPVIEASATSAAPNASRALVDPEPMLPSRGGRAFQWPVRGQIVSDFGAKSGGLHNDGINIAAARGTAVRAAESGVVVYAGNEVRGFGNLLLIRHADGWMTAYAHVDEINVARDEQVRRGQTVAKVGRTGNVTTPQLHFEIRRGTRSVNPREFLTPETASLN